MFAENVLLVLEIIGTIAFAVSGAFVAIKANLDIFGVIFIGVVTAVGGGMTRDILIGAVPPAIFSNLYILLVAAVTSATVFVIAYLKRKQFDALREKISRINTYFDAIGLAAFSVMGTELAFVKGLSANPVLAIVLGMLTGVGGGIFRDILTNNTPYIFKKHVYALASIGGAGVYYVLRAFTAGTLIPSVISMLFIVGIRLLAAKYRWSLPKVHLGESDPPLPSLQSAPLENGAERQSKQSDFENKQAS
ncbi:MAG: trimeric intracellular cation channel family protein [Clostridia bacterium]|nr:trimeric intracellular cation channel family protein [Clostridia bacterium]